MLYFKKHRKLFYVPGMISLVVLPLICLIFFYSNNAFKQEFAMDVGYPDTGYIAKFKSEFGFPFPRKYTVFIFNGSLEEEKSNLDRFQKRLRNFNKIHDTIGGIKLAFGKHMKYEVYIRVLDVLTIEKTPTYIPYKDNLWIFNVTPKKRKIPSGRTVMNCGTQYYTHLESLRLLEIDKQEKAVVFQQQFLLKHWFLYLPFLGLVSLNIFLLLKLNSNKKFTQKSYLW